MRHPKRQPVVLVVEDNIPVQSVLCEMLARNELSAVAAVDAQEAMTVASEHAVDAFILDLTLAGQDTGLDVLAWLRRQARYEHAPVMILTGHAPLATDQEEAIRRQGARIFYKPERCQILIDCVKRLLEDRAP